MESEIVRWKNEHNVYVNTGLATQEQLQASIMAFKKELIKMFPKGGYEKCEIISNLVTDMKGNSYRFAYVWVSDPRVYYILVGLNPDGTERIKEEKDEEIMDDSFTLDSFDLESAFKSEIKVKKPSIQVNLPPLLTLPGYEYTEEQKSKASEDLRAEALNKGEDPNKIVVPSYGYFEVSRAWAGSLKKNESSSTLCSYVPIWVNEDMLKKIFFRFSSDKSGMYPKISFRASKKKLDTRGGFINRFGEPEVEKKLAIVEFSKSHSKDGIFALQMTRKIFVREPALEAKAKKEGTPLSEVKQTTLIFEHFKNMEDTGESSAKKPIRR